MVSDYGARIKPHLLRLFRESKRFWQDESGTLHLGVLRDRARDAANIFRPLGSRVADQGAAGKRLARTLTRASDEGEVNAGQRVAQLDDLELGKLSRDERFHLVDVLEGRALPTLQSIAAKADAIRRIFTGLAAEATASNVQSRQMVTIQPGELEALHRANEPAEPFGGAVTRRMAPALRSPTTVTEPVESGK